MSDDNSLEEEVLEEYGMTRERWREVKMDRDWQIHQRDQFVQGNALLSGQAKTKDEFVADKIDKVRLRDSGCFRPDMAEWSIQ